jgi:hypothetical protein
MQKSAKEGGYAILLCQAIEDVCKLRLYVCKTISGHLNVIIYYPGGKICYL